MKELGPQTGKLALVADQLVMKYGIVQFLLCEYLEESPLSSH